MAAIMQGMQKIAPKLAALMPGMGLPPADMESAPAEKNEERPAAPSGPPPGSPGRPARPRGGAPENPPPGGQ
jgi:hypothetical protein